METKVTHPPLLMVHGWGGSHATTWRETGIEALLQDCGRSIIGIDLLGHGQAAKPHDPKEYVDLSAPIRSATTIRPVDAVGFSLGSIALLHAASIEPNMFRKLMLVGIGDSQLLPHDPNESARIISGVDGTAAEDDLLARQFGNYSRRHGNDPQALIAMLRRPRELELTPQIARQISAEIVVVVGDKDFVLPADQLVSVFANARLVTPRNCDHFGTPENISFIDTLIKFFQ